MTNARRGGGAGLFGTILIVFGGLLLAENLHVLPSLHLGRLIARWWPSILIIVGAMQLLEERRRGAWALILVGGFLQLLTLGLLTRWDIGRFWPVVLIGIGLSMVLRRGRGGAGS
jgi:hypothetical protein